MARVVETLVTQSVLDRLITPEDRWPATRAQSLRLLREALRRDMEWLLNSRRPPVDGSENFDAVSRSVIVYGLFDTSCVSLKSGADRTRLLQGVQDCIAWYEPRLQHVEVTFGSEGANKERQLRFHIEGQIRLDPAPEGVSFDTVLDLTSGEYTVS